MSLLRKTQLQEELFSNDAYMNRLIRDSERFGEQERYKELIAHVQFDIDYILEELKKYEKS